MAERLSRLLGDEIAGRVTIKTFHAFGAMLLRSTPTPGPQPGVRDPGRGRSGALLRQACPDLTPAEVDAALAQISAAKNRPAD